MTLQPKLVGLAELAELLSVTKQAISNWRNRWPDFPSPVAELRSGPIWDFNTVEEWANTKGLELSHPGNGPSSVNEVRSAKVVSMVNMKGGVGKSTLAANLGWYCAWRKDKKVLLVDLDPQFNLSQYVLGNDAYEAHLEKNKPTVIDIFEQFTPSLNSSKKKRSDLQESICKVREWPEAGRIDLIPSKLELAWTLKNPHHKEHLLRDFLQDLKTRYDLIIIDAPPTESVLTLAAYRASDFLLVPVRPEFLATIGLPLLARSLEDFQGMFKNESAPEIAGILFNDASGKPEHSRSRTYVNKLAKANGWYVFKNELSHSDSYAAGARAGRPIFLTDYARSWKKAEFNRLAEEFLERVPL